MVLCSVGLVAAHRRNHQFHLQSLSRKQYVPSKRQTPCTAAQHSAVGQYTTPSPTNATTTNPTHTWCIPRIHVRWRASLGHYYPQPTVRAPQDLRLISTIAYFTTRRRPDICGSVCPSSGVTITNAFKRAANLRTITPYRIHRKFNFRWVTQELPCPAIRPYRQPVEPKPHYQVTFL